MSVTTSSSVSSVVGEKSPRRKFKLTIGGRIMATRGKRMSRGRGSSKRTMSRGKRKKR